MTEVVDPPVIEPVPEPTPEPKTPKEVIDAITPADFKKKFPQVGAFRYLMVWDSETVYYTGEEVFYNRRFFESLIDNNQNNQPDLNPEQWEKVEDSINNFISDDQILEAIAEAKGNFNYNLFGNNFELLKIAFLYLVAHYLIMDLSMNNNAFALPFLMTSKSVGAVSASYGVPEYILNKPMFSYLGTTNFGLKYISYLYPRTIGAGIRVVCGTTDPV